MNRGPVANSRSSSATLRGRRGRAFACTVAIMVTGVLLIFTVVLARYAASEIAGLQTELLGAQADQILLSAREWSAAQGARLRSAGAIELSLEELLLAPAIGRLDLRHVTDAEGPPLIECHLRITQGRRSVARHVFWPARGSD